MKIFYAGTFNPFTTGHADIVNRALSMGYEVTIGLGVNSTKEIDSESERRAEELRRHYAGRGGVEVVCYRGATCEAAKAVGATALLRGLRTNKDYEYERELAEANLKVFGMETLFLTAEPSLAWISSSMIRELRRLGKDTTEYVVAG